MIRKHTSADEIFKMTMQKIAPLPCQEAYARQLAAILSFHIHKNILIDDGTSVDDLPSMSAMVVAPTGQGKTYLIRRMTELLGLSCINVDCSTLCREGWKGVSLSQRLLAAKRSVKDPTVFARSILFLDEFDKLRLWGSKHDETNPMNNILQLFNSGVVAAENEDRVSENIDISRFTILLGGAFEGLDKIIEQRLRPRAKIGFTEYSRQEKQTTAELLQQVTIPDLVEFGIMREIMGRVGTILTISPMELEDYRQLLGAATGSVRQRFDNYLRQLYGVRFEISDAGVDAIAQKCMESGTGARAVNPLVNELMASALTEVERDDSICTVVLDANEDGCYVRFESGIRGHSFHEWEQDSKKYVDLSVVKIRGKSIKNLVDRLCRYYRNACDNEPIDMGILPMLEPFLNCSLTYIYRYCRKEDFNFYSLEKLARTIQQKGHGRTTFEIMMDSKMENDPSYHEFRREYDPALCSELVEALSAILWYLCEYHGEVWYQFELKR